MDRLCPKSLNWESVQIPLYRGIRSNRGGQELRQEAVDGKEKEVAWSQVGRGESGLASESFNWCASCELTSCCRKEMLLFDFPKNERKLDI